MDIMIKNTVLLIISILMVGCPKHNTMLDVIIIDDPVGGNCVSELSCKFKGRLVNGDKTIRASVEWWATDGEVKKRLEKELFTFDSNKYTEYTTTYAAPEGYILINYWYVRIDWTDEDGTEHDIESNRAYCYYEQDSDLQLSKKEPYIILYP